MSMPITMTGETNFPCLFDKQHLKWEIERQQEEGLSWIGASWEHGRRLAEEEYKQWQPKND